MNPKPCRKVNSGLFNGNNKNIDLKRVSGWSMNNLHFDEY